jgi:hypothetical protein
MMVSREEREEDILGVWWWWVGLGRGDERGGR